MEKEGPIAGVYFDVRSIALSACLLTAMLSSGCLVLALQPAYNAESVVFDEALIGEWENADDGTSATIERGEWRAYKVTYAGSLLEALLPGRTSPKSAPRHSST